MDRGKTVFALLAVFAALVFVRLGFWQLARHAEVRDAGAERDARLAEPAVPLTAVLDGSAPLDAEDLAWRRVAVSGTWRYGRDVLIRNRGREGLPGVQVITPLVVSAGPDEPDSAEVLVLRGWLPAPDGADPGGIPAGGTELASTEERVGILRPSREGEGDPVVAIGDGNDRVLSFAAIDVGAIQRGLAKESGAAASTPATASDAPRFFVQLLPGPDSAAASTTGPVPIPLPEPGNGPHLSYAIQWFAFAAVALIGTWALLFRPRLRTGPEAA